MERRPESGHSHNRCQRNPRSRFDFFDDNYWELTRESEGRARTSLTFEACQLELQRWQIVGFGCAFPRSSCSRLTKKQLGVSEIIRKDIQALRALAVMAVFVYHLRPSMLTGGFIGVDVFFVLSGYLISSHLFQEFHKSGTLSLSKFWSRRAKRLLPASFTVLAATSLGIWFLAPQALQERFYRDISAASVYAANWVFAFDSVDYLAAENSASVVQQFWSLGVEEQLYIAWPILLSIAWLFGRKRNHGFRFFAILLSVITLASLTYSVLLVFDHNPIAYFSTFSRAWEFGAGALLSLATRNASQESKAGFTLQHAMSWTGWITLAGYLYFFEATSGFPGLYAVVPVISTLLILGANNPSGAYSPSWVLNLRPIQLLGDASYSIYLWHWPILTFAGFYYSRIPGRLLILIFITTILISIFSMKFIENPFRFGSLREKLNPVRTFLAVATSMAILLGSSQAASAFISSEIDQRREASAALEAEISKSLADKEAQAGTGASDPKWDELSCMGPAFMVEPQCAGFRWKMIVPAVAVNEETAHNVKALKRIGSEKGCLSWGDDYSMIECVYGVMGGAKVAMIGDSHAYHWLPAMANFAVNNNIQLHFLARAGCPANALPREANGDHVRGCFSWIAEMRQWVKANQDTETIIVSNFSGSRFSGAGEYGARHDAAIQGYKDIWQPWIGNGIEVIVFKDTPFIGEDAWNCVVKNADSINICDVTHASIEATYDNSVAAAEELGLEVIDFTKYFCKDGMCPMAIGGVRVYRDSNHMSGTFNLLMAPYLKRELELLD